MFVQVRARTCVAAAADRVSDLPDFGQQVVSDLSQDVDSLSRTWTDAGGKVAAAPACTPPADVMTGHDWWDPRAVSRYGAIDGT